MTKEGDTSFVPAVSKTERRKYGDDQMIVAPPPQLPTKTEMSKIEACKKLADAVLMATEKTLDHFVRTGYPRTNFKRKDGLDGVDKEIKISAKGYYFLSGAFYETSIKFVDEKSKLWSKMPRIGIGGRAMNGFERLGEFRAPFQNLSSEINDEAFQNDLARFVGNIVKASDKYFNQNQDDTPQINDIALGHVQDALETFFANPKENKMAKTYDTFNPYLTPQMSREQVEGFKALSGIVFEATQKTLTALGQKPRIRHMQAFSTLQNRALFYGHKSALNPTKSFRAEMDFYEVGDDVQTNHFVLDRNTGSSDFAGRLNIPFQPDEVMSAASLQKSAQRKGDISRFIAEMVITHMAVRNGTSAQKEKIRQTAEVALEDLLLKYSTPPISLFTKDHTNELQSIGEALQQSLARTLDDVFLRDQEQKPEVKLHCKTNDLKIYLETGRVKGWWKKFRSEMEYALQFDITPDAQLSRDLSIEGESADSMYGIVMDRIPFEADSESIIAELTPDRLSHIAKTICKQIRQEYAAPLKNNNLETVRNLETIFQDHFKHALAASCGGALSLENKALELTKFDEEEANKRFRDETNALKKAGRSDHYLLQTFGMAAGNKAGEDASVIAEWQIGRTLRLPESLEKIRGIHDTLATFVDMDVETRARQAGSLLSRMRSLQKTITRDNEILMREAESIHGAKSLMGAHETILQKYVQGFNAMKDSLIEIFGQATIEKREHAILTNLSAAQIHTGNQQSIHEKLNLQMLEQISDFSTHMSFLAKSMRDIVEETTLGTLLDDGQTIADLSSNALAQAGLSEARIKALQDMNKETLEQSILLKIEDLREQLSPITVKIENIDTHLTLADRSEERLRITDQSDSLDND